jgi:outer membrane receptor protein involved in Fe transport
MAKKWLLRLAPLALLLGAVPAYAQNASSITGVVTDGATGKPVEGAVIVITNPAAQVEQTVVSESGGKYTVPDLPAGEYKLAVQLDGFKPFERGDLKLKENTTLRANAALTPEGVQLEEVVVTGSRIRRKDLTTPAPVTVLNREAVQASGKVSVGDFLQSLPEQGNAINTGVNNGGDGSVRIALRSLGDQRTLVLVNGRRMVPGGAGADASVDLNTIPTAAIERIEVLKDGASAVYGSDAIAGVVNIITRKNYNGADVSWYSGMSGHGDAKINDVAATFGSANDQGSIVFSAGLYDQQPAMAGDRDFSAKQFFYDATGENGNGTPGEYPSGSSRTPGGRVSLGSNGAGATPLWQYYQNTYGTSGYVIHDRSLADTAPSVAACVAANPGVAVEDCKWRKMNTSVMAPQGDLYNFAPYNYLLTPSRRYNFYAAGDRKLGDYARAFFEATYVNRQSKEQLAPEPLIIGAGGLVDPGGNLVTIAANNFYNPFGVEVTSASRRLNEFGDRIHERDIHTYRIVGGFDGTFPEVFGPLKGWAWDTSINYGRTFGTYLLRGNLQTSRVQAALGPSSTDASGNPICVDNNGTQIPGCVPLDMFHGAPSITAAQVAPLTFNGTSKGYNELVAFQANTNGDLFKLFGERPVGLALGYEHRFLGGGFTNDPLTAKFDSSNGGSQDTGGHYTVDEGYGELSIPIVANVPLAEELELNAALRYFNYSNFGSDSTYKLGARWTPVRDITLRGTYSTAFRAPDISDLFTGQFDNFPNVSDPCAHSASPECVKQNAANNGDDSTQLRSTNGGNPKLKPETAKIYTVGLVYQPRFIPAFSLTVDYYNIAIKKAITTIGESTILAGCYSGGNQAFCNLVVRDPTSHQITNIVNLNANVGEESSAGVDLAGRYDLKTEHVGRFGFDAEVAWLQKHDQVLADGTKVKGRGTFDLQTSSGQGGTNPEWKGNLGVTWGLGPVGGGVSTKFIGSFKECGDSNGDFSGSGLCYVDSTFQRRVKSYNTYDLFVSYRLTTFAGKTSLAVGVNNVFDANPPKIYNTFASATDQYSYDQIGRFFYLRLNHSL